MEVPIIQITKKEIALLSATFVLGMSADHMLETSFRNHSDTPLPSPIRHLDMKALQVALQVEGLEALSSAQLPLLLSGEIKWVSGDPARDKEVLWMVDNTSPSQVPLVPLSVTVAQANWLYQIGYHNVGCHDDRLQRFSALGKFAKAERGYHFVVSELIAEK